MEQTKQQSQEHLQPSSTPIEKSSFSQLFTLQEIGYYGSAVLVYIGLGLAFRDKVLNIGIGPLFFIAWIWVVPPLWELIVKRVNDR